MTVDFKRISCRAFVGITHHARSTKGSLVALAALAATHVFHLLTSEPLDFFAVVPDVFKSVVCKIAQNHLLPAYTRIDITVCSKYLLTFQVQVEKNIHISCLSLLQYLVKIDIDLLSFPISRKIFHSDLLLRDYLYRFL